MSADNGIYILHTSDDQYRVAYLSAIDNMTFHWVDIDDEYDLMYIHRAWKNSTLCSSKEQALAIAENMRSDIPFLEYGIVIIDVPFRFPTREDVKKQIYKYMTAWSNKFSGHADVVPTMVFRHYLMFMQDVLDFTL